MIVSIDPGATGALAFLDDEAGIVEIVDMPYADRSVLAPVVAGHVRRLQPRAAVLERAQAMPGQGGVSMFAYGTGYGVLQGVLGALDVPFETVHPGVWKRGLGLTANKGASRRRAIERWPAHADLFARVKDDGRAEAALLGDWWMRRAET